jgi:hypothetical protein
LLESSHQVFTIASLDEKIKFVDFILSEDLIQEMTPFSH